MTPRVILELRAVMGAMARPWLVLSVWLLLTASAVSLARLSGSLALALATLACAVGTGIVSFALAFGGLGLLVDSRGLLLPGRSPILALAGRALLAMLALTVVVPALVLGLAQGSLWAPLLMAGAALTGLAIPRLPFFTTAAICTMVFLPRALSAAQRHWLGSLMSGTQVLALGCATVLVLVLWRWWGLARGDARALEEVARSRLLIAMERGDNIVAARPDGWWWFPVVAGPAATASPARIIGTCLGAPYAPGLQSRLRFMLEAALSVAVIAVAFGAGLALRQPWGWSFGLRAISFLCLVLTWTVFGERIVRVFGRASGELAELALLPGLGDRRAQLKALCRAAFGMPLLTSIGLSALIVGTALAQPAPAADTVVFTASTTLLGAAFMMITLARPRRLYPHALSVACIVVFGAWVMAGWNHPAFHVLWLAPALAACLILAVGGYRLSVLPHPFVLR